MVNTALARPAKGAITAEWQKEGDQARVFVHFTNLSGVTLSADNSAQIFVIAYENKKIVDTSRYVRSLSYKDFDNLANGASEDFEILTPVMSGIDWAKMHFIVLADYKPDPENSLLWDVLQGAEATAMPTTFAVSPQDLVFDASYQNPVYPAQTISTSGTNFTGWTATKPADADWLTITPATGAVGSSATVNVIKSKLGNAWKQTTISFTTGDNQFTATVNVKARLQGPPMTVSPSNLVFDGSDGNPAIPAQIITISGSNPSGWKLTLPDNCPWLSVSPTTGPMESTATVTVDPNLLPATWQEVVLRFSSVDGVATGEVNVRARFFGSHRIYLPMIIR